MAEQITNYQCRPVPDRCIIRKALDKLKCDYCGTEYEVAEIEAMYARRKKNLSKPRKKGRKRDGTEKQQQAKAARRGLGYFGYQ